MTDEEAIKIIDRFAHHPREEIFIYPRGEAIEAFEMAIEALRTKPKWIPITWDLSKCEANSTEFKPVDISDIYPESLLKRPCSDCENEDSIYICDQCCFKYDSWFKKKEELK